MVGCWDGGVGDEEVDGRGVGGGEGGGEGLGDFPGGVRGDVEEGLGGRGLDVR